VGDAERRIQCTRRPATGSSTAASAWNDLCWSVGTGDDGIAAVPAPSDPSPDSASNGSVSMLTLCHEIMQDHLEYVDLATPVTQLARRMRDQRLGFLPVCDDRGHALGIVTDRDLVVRALARGLPMEQLTAAHVMTRELITCRPNDPLERAIELMVRHRKCHILVTDGAGKLWGCVSLAEVAQAANPMQIGRVLRAVTEREYRVRQSSARPPPPPPPARDDSQL
jgi:CBS domain-containing protein